jgi:hypothetical protein
VGRRSTLLKPAITSAFLQQRNELGQKILMVFLANSPQKTAVPQFAFETMRIMRRASTHARENGALCVRLQHLKFGCFECLSNHSWESTHRRRNSIKQMNHETTQPTPVLNSCSRIPLLQLRPA